jgi:anhydro-N-acetylmuramic acid kinase
MPRTDGLYIGAMTGTSVDGLDLALISTTGKMMIERGATTPLPDDLRTNLLALVTSSRPIDLDFLGHADVALGRFIGEAVLDFMTASGLHASDIIAIGSHGQTIRHRPVGQYAFTMQIGDPNQITELTGVPVVADFRRRDVSAGGQGAPLVPPFHRAIFADKKERRIVLNIGGIANITRLASEEPLTGFDTGPGNGLSDIWTARHLHLSQDQDGAWARSGKLNGPLLNAFLSDPYFDLPAPKSTGREYFNIDWVAKYAQALALPPEDVQATLVECTACSIALAINREYAATDRVIVCGGGRRNLYLMERIGRAMACPVEPSEVLGVDGDSLEAAAFAWLAMKALQNEPANEPSVTGAKSRKVLGVVYR